VVGLRVVSSNFLSFLYVAPQLAPGLVPSNSASIGALHRDQEEIVERIVLELCHSLKIGRERFTVAAFKSRDKFVQCLRCELLDFFYFHFLCPPVSWDCVRAQGPEERKHNELTGDTTLKDAV